MPNLLLIVSLWLHALATAVLIGNFLLLSLVYLPAWGQAGGAALAEASKRSRAWLYAALVIFAITGTHLTLADSNYLGLGNFGNAWVLTMLIKHVLVLAMLALGFWFNAILRVGPNSAAGKPENLARLRQYANLMAALGALVLLLTSIGQAL